MCLAVPGEVLSLYPAHGTMMGKVSFGGIVKEVCFAYLPEIEVGDFAIVHVGFAISKMDQASAQQTLQTFAELGVLEEELAELQSAAGLPTDDCPNTENVTADQGQPK